MTVFSRSSISRTAVATVWGSAGSQSFLLGSYNVNTCVSTTGQSNGGNVIEMSGQKLGGQPAQITVVSVSAPIVGVGAHYGIIESGSAEVAMGNGLVRTETITTSLDPSCDFNQQIHGYGFSGSSRMNYSMLYEQGSLKFINQGWTNSHHSITLSGC